MSEGLKPCPYCGYRTEGPARLSCGAHYVDCMRCAMSASPGATRAEAVEKWNALPRRDPNALPRGTRVKKKSGGEWQGRIVGEYSTELNKEGYAVESEVHKGSVQIYPRAALEVIA